MSDTPQQSATPRTDAATYNGHACLKAECKALEIELSQAEAVIDRWAGQPGSFARCEKLETELATARRLLAEERQHTEDLKAHQAEEVRQIRAEVERLKASQLDWAESSDKYAQQAFDLRAQLQAKEQELAGEREHVRNYVAKLNRPLWEEFHAKGTTDGGWRCLVYNEIANVLGTLAARDATIAVLRDSCEKLLNQFVQAYDAHEIPKNELTERYADEARARLASLPKPNATAPKDRALALTSFCGLPADALEKHLKVCPPDCDPAIWQPDATQATGEAQPRSNRTDEERLNWLLTSDGQQWHYYRNSERGPRADRAAIDAAMSRTGGGAT